MSTSKATRNWKIIAKEAQTHRDQSIRRVDEDIVSRQDDELPLDVTGIPQQVLTLSEIEITQLSPEDLVQKLSAGTVPCVVVVKAFLRRAALAQSLVSSIRTLILHRT